MYTTLLFTVFFCICAYNLYVLLTVCIHLRVCVCTPSIPGSVPGVVSSWECTVTTCCFRMQQNSTDGGAELIALLWRSSDPSTNPRTRHPPSARWYKHRVAQFNEVLFFKASGGLQGWRDGGKVWEPLCSFSSSVSLNSFHKPIDAPVFSWPFSAVTRHWGMQIHVRNWPDTFPVRALRSKTPQLSNKWGEGLVSQKADREEERPFPSKFSLSVLTRWGCERTLGKVHLFLDGEAAESEKKGIRSLIADCWGENCDAIKLEPELNILLCFWLLFITGRRSGLRPRNSTQRECVFL